MNGKAKHSPGRRDGNGAGVEHNRGVRYKIPSNRRLIGRASERRGKMIAFGYYGGKFSHLDFILPLLPTHFTHYCEVFGGSAAVLINRPPAQVETYNDLDGEIVNFFQCLRDLGDDLVRLIGLTPFSRAELVRALTPSTGLTNLERARRFFVRARQTRTGLAQTSSEGRWAHCVLTSRAEMAGAVSRWLGSVEGLPEIVQRLQRVQIENAPAREIILRYDSPDTLFYCDPPYPHEARGDSKAYGYEMTDAEHEGLARVLHTVRGAVALSGYRCALMDRLYTDWHRVDADTRLCNSSKGERTESLWTNYDPATVPFPRTADAAEHPCLLDRQSRKQANRNGCKK
jgi:DNA adenine methylase